MTRKEKNQIYWRIAIFTLDWYKTNAGKSFFLLSPMQTYELGNLAEALNIKPRQGWSIARTLWERIHEGRPF